jgi:hypothetical protein
MAAVTMKCPGDDQVDLVRGVVGFIREQEFKKFKYYVSELRPSLMYGAGTALLLGTGIGAGIGALVGSGAGGIGAGPGAGIGAAIGFVSTASTIVSIASFDYFTGWIKIVDAKQASQFVKGVTSIAGAADPDLICPISLEFPLRPVCIEGSPQVYDYDALERYYDHNKGKGPVKPPVPINGREFFTMNDVRNNPYSLLVTHKIAMEILEHPSNTAGLGPEYRTAAIALAKQCAAMKDEILNAESKYLFKKQQKGEMAFPDYLRHLNKMGDMLNMKLKVDFPEIKPTSAATAVAVPCNAPKASSIAATATTAQVPMPKNAPSLPPITTTAAQPQTAAVGTTKKDPVLVNQNKDQKSKK